MSGCSMLPIWIVQGRELENRFRCPFALCFAACHGYGLQLPCGKQHDPDRHLGLSHPSAFGGTYLLLAICDLYNAKMALASLPAHTYFNNR